LLTASKLGERLQKQSAGTPDQAFLFFSDHARRLLNTAFSLNGKDFRQSSHRLQTSRPSSFTMFRHWYALSTFVELRHPPSRFWQLATSVLPSMRMLLQVSL
jgi:hypothetical protein